MNNHLPYRDWLELSNSLDWPIVIARTIVLGFFSDVQASFNCIHVVSLKKKLGIFDDNIFRLMMEI